MAQSQLRILISTDLTERSSRALARSFLLAEELEAKLRVVHVVDSDRTPQQKDHAIDWGKKTLAREVEEFTAATGVDATFEVVTGCPKTEITKRSTAADTDLVIMGLRDPLVHGEKPFAETTAGTILKSTHTAALLVKMDAIEPYRRACVGVDLSNGSREVVRHASRIAPRARLSLVHAYSLPFQGFLNRQTVAAEVACAEEQGLSTFVEDGMVALEQFAQEDGLVSYQIEKIAREGDPREVLREECESKNADLLAIGTHARTGISGAIWGSVAADILDSPPCDVLAIRPS